MKTLPTTHKGRTANDAATLPRTIAPNGYYASMPRISPVVEAQIAATLAHMLDQMSGGGNNGEGRPVEV